MKKGLKIFITIILIFIIAITTLFVITYNRESQDLQSIKSKKQLLNIYNGDEYQSNDMLLKLSTMPFSILAYQDDFFTNNRRKGIVYEVDYSATNTYKNTESISDAKTSSNTSVKDYSTTNIQLENVDEADITKTDGNYIYSISENKVIITDVRDINNVKIISKIEETDDNAPEDLILYNDKLVVISTKTSLKNNYFYNRNNNTIVEIYDIKDRSNPSLVKDYELFEPYYTSRCIDNQLYVISSGYLRKENNEIITYYKENSATKEIKLDDIKYLKDVKTSTQTLISSIDLNDTKKDVNVNSYLIDISNAYVSENSIYLLNKKYIYESYVPPISSIFGPLGIFGAFEYDFNYMSDGYFTDIYKFDILKDGKIQYNTKTKVDGQTINQYSLDEKNGHLRVALYDNNGTRIVIFNEKLNEIGRTDNLAKGEKMYSTRFIGDKAYLVTYKTIDPLFVIDLSNEENPKVLGKLKIPGYSTYLHPYDENHIIGIGMETEEIVNRDSTGRIRSTTAKVTGMKMALFDISNVESPKQISNVVIGDSRVTSAILTNPKALLFSKEKELIAIPVNNYADDFEINTDTDKYEDMIESYKNYNKSYIAEGYFVYKINLTEGFNLKGVITHEKQLQNKSYYYYNNSKMLRGLYIDNNLYTVSEDMIKVNKLDNLEQLVELKIR